MKIWIVIIMFFVFLVVALGIRVVQTEASEDGSSLNIIKLIYGKRSAAIQKNVLVVSVSSGSEETLGRPSIRLVRGNKEFSFIMCPNGVAIPVCGTEPSLEEVNLLCDEADDMRSSESGQFEKNWTYVVKSEDTLSNIASRYLEDGRPETWKELAKDLGIKDPDKIYPGQILRLPHVYMAICDGKKITGWSRDLKDVEDSVAIKMVTGPDLKCRIKTKAPR